MYRIHNKYYIIIDNNIKESEILLDLFYVIVTIKFYNI